VVRVLIVEDDGRIRAELEAAVRGGGHEVETAPDGKAALRTYAARPYDLVITDIFMPEQDGIGVIMQLKKARRDLPIIAISEVSELLGDDFLRTARMLGAARTFRKPVDASALLRAVEELLGHEDPASGGSTIP
jgi:CheY-like chemotaxis protein